MPERNYMPILMDKSDRDKIGFDLTRLPMHLFNEDSAIELHGQSLDRLAERGGLAPFEMVANIKRLSRNEIDELWKEGDSKNVQDLLNLISNG